MGTRADYRIRVSLAIGRKLTTPEVRELNALRAKGYKISACIDHFNARIGAGTGG